MDVAVLDDATASPTDERAARGRSVRAQRPRRASAGWTPHGDRPDPIALLEAQGHTRVTELLPIRYGRMSESAFAFYRGAAAIMASDLAPRPTSGLSVQLCGDAHLSNFGAFAAPDRQLVFDINDFDETHPGPFEWDLERLGASFEIAGRSLGLGAADRTRAVLQVGESYRTAIRDFAQRTELDIWYARLDLEGVLSLASGTARKADLDLARRNARRANRKDRYRALGRLTERVDGELRFRSDPPLLVPGEQLFPEVEPAELARRIELVIAEYRSSLPHKYRHLLERYRYVHIARKVVGVGSVGTRAWVVLLIGRDDEDPLFLQVKQAQPSVLEPYTAACRYDSHGERVVAGQSMLQTASDIFLGWATVTGPDGVDRDYYVRQLWDWKTSADITTMSAKRLAAYARICGWTLAHAHARTGDPIAIAAYLGKGDVFERSLTRFAGAYADQNERDFDALRTAIESGRLAARSGI